MLCNQKFYSSIDYLWGTSIVVKGSELLFPFENVLRFNCVPDSAIDLHYNDFCTMGLHKHHLEAHMESCSRRKRRKKMGAPSRRKPVIRPTGLMFKLGEKFRELAMLDKFLLDGGTEQGFCDLRGNQFTPKQLEKWRCTCLKYIKVFRKEYFLWKNFVKFNLSVHQPILDRMIT